MAKYDRPEMEILTIDAEDIVVTSDNTGEFDGEWVTIGGN